MEKFTGFSRYQAKQKRPGRGGIQEKFVIKCLNSPKLCYSVGLKFILIRSPAINITITIGSARIKIYEHKDTG